MARRRSFGLPLSTGAPKSTKPAFSMLKVASPENASFRIAVPAWQSCVTGLCRSQAR